MSNLEGSKKKILDLLRKVRVENKALKAQINNLQNEAIQIEGPTYKRVLAQKLLDDKEKEIQTLKRKLKIPATQLTQIEELDDFEKEKETLNTELTDYKAKLLKLEETERKWGADIHLLNKS